MGLSIIQEYGVRTILRTYTKYYYYYYSYYCFSCPLIVYV